MTARVRMRQIGWLVMLSLALASLLALTFKVNAVKGQVRLVEREIVAAQRARMMLETEFQTRASQQQLADWNAVEFGYSAPRADQYVEHERQLAALGAPRGKGAPSPIRFAMAREAESEDSNLLTSLLGEDEPAEAAHEAPARNESHSRGGTLAERLARPNAAAFVAATEIAQ